MLSYSGFQPRNVHLCYRSFVSVVLVLQSEVLINNNGRTVVTLINAFLFISSQSVST
jgi:hypothetical protein